MIWSTISTTWWHRFYIFKLCSFKTIGSRLARAGLLQHWKTRTKEIPSDPGYCVFYITQTKSTLIIQTKPNFALSTIPFQYCQSTDKCCYHLQIINFKLKHAHGNQKWVKGQKKLLELVQAPFSFGLRMAKGKVSKNIDSNTHSTTLSCLAELEKKLESFCQMFDENNE